jgi:GT2 family glycosyltransferase
MFLGDDTAPAGEDLLARHGELHAARPEREYAVLGHVRWADDPPITPLMRWLDRGPQFAYEGLPSGLVDTAAYLYTAHVSLKKSVFDACGGFDTRFPHAAVEDIELGVRLAALGVVLDYHRELEVLHSHPTTLERWLERMRLVGRSAALFERIHPGERNPTVSIPKGPLYACVRAAAPAVAPLDHPSAPLFLRHLRWRILHHAAYSAGYRQGPPTENGRAT